MSLYYRNYMKFLECHPDATSHPLQSPPFLGPTLKKCCKLYLLCLFLTKIHLSGDWRVSSSHGLWASQKQVITETSLFPAAWLCPHIILMSCVCPCLLKPDNHQEWGRNRREWYQSKRPSLPAFSSVGSQLKPGFIFLCLCCYLCCYLSKNLPELYSKTIEVSMISRGITSFLMKTKKLHAFSTNHQKTLWLYPRALAIF